MIVKPKGELIAWLFIHGRSIDFICKRVNLPRVHVLEHLERRGLYVRRILKTKAQRQALERLRYAAGNRALGSAFLPGVQKPRACKERRHVSTRMIVWRGFARETEVEVRVRDVGVGAGLITCIECGGEKGFVFHDGWEACVECKGTGKTFVSI